MVEIKIKLLLLFFLALLVYAIIRTLQTILIKMAKETENKKNINFIKKLY